jgi:hypothetical protein
MASWADVDAIRDYMNRHEAQLRAVKEGPELLEKFRVWYLSKNELDQLFRTDTAVSEAKWYRDRANQLMGMPNLAGWDAGDSEAAAKIPPAAKDPTPPPPTWFERIPWWVKASGIGLLALGVWHMFSYEGDDD